MEPNHPEYFHAWGECVDSLPAPENRLREFDWTATENHNTFLPGVIGMLSGDGGECGSGKWCEDGLICTAAGTCCLDCVPANSQIREPNDGFSGHHRPQNCRLDNETDEVPSRGGANDKLTKNLFYSCDNDKCNSIAAQDVIKGPENAAENDQCGVISVWQKFGNNYSSQFSEKTLAFRFNDEFLPPSQGRHGDQQLQEMAEYKICEICGLQSDCLVTQKSQGNTCGSVNALFGARIGETEQAFWICNTGHINGCDKPIRHFSLLKVDRQWNGFRQMPLPTNKEDICFMEIQELYDQRTEKPQTWDLAREQEVQYTCNAFMMWMFTAEELDAIDENITAADLEDQKMQTPKVIPYKVRRWMVVYALKGGADCLKDYNTYQFVFKTKAPQKVLDKENEYSFGKYLYRNSVWPSKDNFWGPRDFRSLFSAPRTDSSTNTETQWGSQRVLAGASSFESFDKNSRILQTESGNADNT
jgi:hypothetical protein